MKRFDLCEPFGVDLGEEPLEILEIAAVEGALSTEVAVDPLEAPGHGHAALKQDLLALFEIQNLLVDHRTQTRRIASQVLTHILKVALKTRDLYLRLCVSRFGDLRNELVACRGLDDLQLHFGLSRCVVARSNRLELAIRLDQIVNAILVLLLRGRMQRLVWNQVGLTPDAQMKSDGGAKSLAWLLEAISVLQERVEFV